MSKRNLSIPEELASVLERDEWIEAYVKAALAEFTPVLRVNQLRFFPNYTDHGIEHIEGVLTTAFSLVRDEARPHLRPADAAVLILSVLVHDIALHIQKDGIVGLLCGDSPHRAVPWFAENLNDRPWPVMWREYVTQVSRFSGRQNQEIFGTVEPVEPPLLDVGAEWGELQDLMVGEFVRRHHGRLAHEIALFGYPGPAGGASLGLSEKLGDLRDLAGVVARSHTLPLRPCVDYLASAFSGNRRDPRQVHAPLLMGLLRIADYLQVESSRAPRQLLSLKTLRSPLSVGEWKVHHAIVDINTSLDDREALFIEARPRDAATFLRLKQLLTGIQNEMDQSWAVLGEVYGPIPEKHSLGFVLRRVRSNLDDSSKFAATVDFLPERAAFEAADADLLKLLISPLYGDSPEVGIRELVQNSIDSVRELQSLLADNPGLVTKLRPRTEQSADVAASLYTDSNGDHWVSITDKGTGMTAEMVRAYFLRAGASFRMSEVWKRQFEDQNHQSKVLRTGRFGVGALAAFLLGEEISVVTRHFDDTRGCRFNARIDTDPIEIQFVDDVPTGTEICVKITSTVYTRLTEDPIPYHDLTGRNSWDWYCLTTPSIVRSIEGAHLTLSPHERAPAEGEELSGGWFRLAVDGYNDVHWKYERRPRLICNGFFIARHVHWQKGLFQGELDAPLRVPSISVFDRDGVLPLTLDRRGLTHENVLFADELAGDVLRDLIAFALVHPPSGGVFTRASANWYLASKSHPALQGTWGDSYGTAWFSTDKGFGLLAPGIVARLKRSVLVHCFSGTGERPQVPINEHVAVEYRATTANTNTLAWIRRLFASTLPNFPEVHADVQVLLGNRYIKDGLILKLPKYIQARLVERYKDEHVTLFTTGNSHFDHDLLDLTSGITSKRERKTVRLAEWNPKSENLEESTLADLWREIVGDVIPFDADHRREIATQLDTDLARFVAHWESRGLRS
jgi:hypothetical protein